MKQTMLSRQKNLLNSQLKEVLLTMTEPRIHPALMTDATGWPPEYTYAFYQIFFSLHHIGMDPKKYRTFEKRLFHQLWKTGIYQ